MADLNAEYTERNVEIFKRLEAGETRHVVAFDFGLTRERVKQIHATIKMRERGRLIREERVAADALPELSVKLSNLLRAEGITTISQAREYTDAQFLRIPEFGRKSLNELRAAIGDGVDAPTRRETDKAHDRIEALESRIDELESFISDILSSRVAMMDRMNELAASIENLKSP